MKPPELKHLIKAAKKGEKKRGDKRGGKPNKDTGDKGSKPKTIDIRLEKWEKIEGVWFNESGYTPKDPLSIKKVENWIEEITSLAPKLLRDDSHLNRHPDEALKEFLEGQLSAVEGHKKIEIEETKDTWVKPEIEEIKEEERIGQELEQEPWVDRAKTLVGILLAAIIAIFFIYANQPTNPKTNQGRLFIKQEFVKLDNANWSQAKNFPSIGRAYLYNTDWRKIKASDSEIKQVLITIQEEYRNKTLRKVELPEKEQLRRVKEIVELDRPLIIFIPYGSINTKLWISRTGSVIQEQHYKNDIYWDFLKSEKINDIAFLTK